MITAEMKVNGAPIGQLTLTNIGVVVDGESLTWKEIEAAPFELPEMKDTVNKAICLYAYDYYQTGKGKDGLLSGTVKHDREGSVLVLLKKAMSAIATAQQREEVIKKGAEQDDTGTSPEAD